MDALDIFILVLLGLLVIKFIKAGIIAMLLSFTGLVLGLFLASRLIMLVSGHISNTAARTFLIVFFEVSLALALWNAGLALSRKLEIKSRAHFPKKVNEIIGGVVGVLLSLIVIWLLASGLENVRGYQIGPQVKRSLIVQQINAVLPPSPDVFAQLQKLVSPNGFPNVFLGYEPAHINISPYNQVNDSQILAAQTSVVKVRGTACNNLSYGSGFVAAKDLVVTNAHVVAGVSRPQVVDSRNTYLSKPVWFDPSLDIAVLRVANLADDPLVFANERLHNGSAAAVLGFPGSNSLVNRPATVIDRVITEGRNIYDEGLVNRSIYEIQANIEQGASGGPLLAPNGSVNGVIFARSVAYNNVGYALTIDQIKPIVEKSKSLTKPVSTGYCTN